MGNVGSTDGKLLHIIVCDIILLDQPFPMQPYIKQSSVYAPPLTSFQKGHMFEDYVITLFDAYKKRFKLLEWRSAPNSSNGIFVESNRFPDLEFVYLGKYPQRFAIECKWREKFVDGKIEWASHQKICNYVEYEFQNRIPVFVAIGIGGSPGCPEKLFVTPLSNIAHLPEVYESDLIPYKRPPQKPLFFDVTQLSLF